MAVSHPFRSGALSLLLALGAAASLAQSSYQLTVLKAPPTGWILPPDDSPAGTGWVIDSSDRVVSQVTDVSRYVLKYLGFTPEYQDYAYRWPASTATSVGGSRLYSKPANLFGVTPNGQRIAVYAGGNLVYDTVSGKSVGAFPAELFPVFFMNDQGAVVGHIVTTPADFQATGARSLAATWSLGSTLQALRAPGFGSTYAWAINASGVVGGSVQESVNPILHAALWVNGQVQVLPEQNGHASAVVGLNDKGQALIRRAPVQSCVVLPESGNVACYLSGETVVLRDNGVETGLLAAGDARHLGRLLLNNAGAVVGRIQNGAAPDTTGQIDPGSNNGVSSTEVPRTFIWQQGVLSDLTVWVASKGAKLPAGAVLTDVLAINSKGSLVAIMRASGQDSYVRLTAKP
jgi:hypothetical protein